MKEIILNNDAILFGILALILGGIFYTSKQKAFATFYKFVPVLLLCYMIPALLKWPLGIVSEDSNLYFVASRYLLPASLILLCISIDIKGIIRLGPKAVIMFLSATFGIMLGGPIAFLLYTWVFTLPPDMSATELAGGLSTVAGSWIGGGGNQAAMQEVFNVKEDLYGIMIVIDVIVANLWMAFLLSGAKISDKIDRFIGADNSSITKLKESVKSYRESVTKVPTSYHMFLMLGIAFAGVGISHLVSNILVPIFETQKPFLNRWGLDSLMNGFFWMIVVATLFGIALSFTKAKKLEGVGASNWGSVFIYILVATIGMKMNLGEIFVLENLPLFFIGLVWMTVHIVILLGVAYLIKAPFFFVAVGSQANIGGAASAPVVASAFDVSLAPVGVLMAVLGYGLGTVCAYATGLIMLGLAG